MLNYRRRWFHFLCQNFIECCNVLMEHGELNYLQSQRDKISCWYLNASNPFTISLFLCSSAIRRMIVSQSISTNPSLLWSREKWGRGNMSSSSRKCLSVLHTYTQSHTHKHTPTHTHTHTHTHIHAQIVKKERERERVAHASYVCREISSCVHSSSLSCLIGHHMSFIYFTWLGK